MSSRLFLPDEKIIHVPALVEQLHSPDTFTLVCQGGGISGGAYIVGVMKAFREHDILQYIDSVYLSSAAVPAVTYTLMDQWEDLAETWVNEVTSNDVVRFLNVFNGRVVNIESLVDKHLHRYPIDQKDFLDHPVDINFGVSEIVNSTDPNSIFDKKLEHTFLSNQFAFNPLDMIKAAISIPVLYGGNVSLGGRTYLDGGILSQLPFQEVPLNKKMVTVMTQSYSQPLTKASLGERAVLWYDEKIQRTPNFIMDAIKKRGDVLRDEYHDLILRHGKGQPGMIIRPYERLPSFICDNSSQRVQKTIHKGYMDGLNSISDIYSLLEFGSEQKEIKKIRI